MMEIVHGVNAASLTRERGSGIGFTLFSAVKDYYPEILEKFKKEPKKTNVLLSISKGEWPFKPHVFPDLVNIRGIYCSFIVHQEWLDQAFVNDAEVIDIIDSIIAAAAKIIRRELKIESFISPTNKMRGRWNVKEDEHFDLPVMAIRKLIAGELDKAIIFQMPASLSGKELPDKAFELIREFLLGLADQWLGVKSSSRNFFESVKSMSELFVRIGKLIK